MSHASKIFSRRALRRRHTFSLVLLALFLAWGVVWILASRHINNTLDDLIKQAAQQNITVTTTKRFTNGNPFSIHAHLEPFALRMKNGNEIKAKEAVFYLDLWDWSSVSGKLRHGIDAIVMDVSFTAGIIKFAFDIPSKAPEDYTQTGLTVRLQPMGITFAESQTFALGNRLEEALVRFRIMGSVPNFMNPKSIAAWNEASGIIEFDDFNINWGPLTIAANGSVGLDANLQPEGAFSGRVEGLDEALGMLAVQGKIKDNQIALLRSTLDVIARPSSLTGDSAPIVPLSVQGGGVFIGPVKLFELPAIKWE